MPQRYPTRGYPTRREARAGRGDYQTRREERLKRLQKIEADQPTLWDKSRNYVAMGVRGASGVASSMGGPVGAGIAGVGEIGAQAIEKRDKFNFPQVGLQSGIGAIPGSALFKAGSKVANVGRGAMFGSTAAASTQQFDQGPHVPTKEDVMGIGLGAGLGGAGGVVAGRFGRRGKVGAVADDLPTPPPAPAARIGEAARPRDIDPSSLDDIRRSTLQGVRDIRSNPRGVTPRQSQAIADNLEGRFGTPEALESAAEIRRGLPGRDLSRAEGVLQGRATDSVSRRGRLTDLPDRNPADITVGEAQRLRRAGPQSLEDIKPLTPEVTLGAKVKKGPRGKKRKKRSRKKPIKAPPKDNPNEFADAADPVIDAIEDIGPLSSTPTTPFAKVSDSDLKFLAGRGDKAAKAELKRRGASQRQGLGSEVGAVGDIRRLRFGDRIKSERGALDIGGQKQSL